MLDYHAFLKFENINIYILWKIQLFNFSDDYDIFMIFLTKFVYQPSESNKKKLSNDAIYTTILKKKETI